MKTIYLDKWTTIEKPKRKKRKQKKQKKHATQQREGYTYILYVRKEAKKY